MEYDSFSIYVLLTDMVNNAANLEVNEGTTVIARSKKEACELFVKLNPHYIKYWNEDKERKYETLSEEEKKKINEDMLTNDGGIFEIPLKSVAGIENLCEFIKKEAERNSK